MSYPVRILTEKGIESFRAYLHGLAGGSKASPPKEMLYSPTHSADFNGAVVIDQREFPSRLEAVAYFSKVFAGVEHATVDYHPGLWSWLSLFYFDQVCPADPGGARRPGRDYRHIPDRSYRYRHRHLLAGPYHIHHLHGYEARLLLCSPLFRENHFHHELASRQSFITNPAIIEAATILYFDEVKGRPRLGSQSGGKPGTLLRFVDVIQQLDVTYDLYSMSSEKLLSLLPPEFDKWKGSFLLSPPH